MTSPLAKGLFDKAISELGFGRFHLQSFADAERKGKAAAESWGVAGDDVAALRAVPAEKVLGDTTMSHNGFWPMIDGRIIPEQTIDAFNAGHMAHVPFIVGSNSYEIGLFPMMAEGLSQRDAAEWPKAEKLFDGFGRNDPKILEMQVATDLILTEPTRALARASAKAGMPTYVYYYSYVNLSLRARYPGAPHFFEVPAVFATMPLIEPIRTRDARRGGGDAFALGGVRQDREARRLARLRRRQGRMARFHRRRRGGEAGFAEAAARFRRGAAGAAATVN